MAEAVVITPKIQRHLAQVVDQCLQSYGLREQWAALYDDGTWTSGQDETRAEAEEIIAEASEPKPVLARRWVSLWQPPPEPQ